MAITVNGSMLAPGPAHPGSLPANLGLVGGPVTITGATLRAPAGTIHVASAARTGEVPVDPRNAAALTVTSFGPVAVKGGSTLDVSNPGALGAGGSVFIRSGALTIDASEINADNYGSGAGGTLFLRGDSQVALSNGANVHSISMGSGSGARVTISTTPSGAISADASTVQTGSTGPGNGGPLTIETGQLMLTQRGWGHERRSGKWQWWLDRDHSRLYAPRCQCICGSNDGALFADRGLFRHLGCWSRRVDKSSRPANSRCTMARPCSRKARAPAPEAELPYRSAARSPSILGRPSARLRKVLDGQETSLSRPPDPSRSI
jgi:hypothetical protein